MSIEPADLARFLDPSFLDDLESRTMAQLRAARSELQEAEGAISYLRRLVQGRLDIVAAERQRRTGGFDGGGAADLLEQLPGILADSGSRSGNRLLSQFEPGDMAAGLVAELDRNIDPAQLTDLPALSDEVLAELTDSMAVIERQLSDSRRAIHDRIDRFQAELVRRYQSGEASVDSLLG
ncbi:MAG: RsiG family protein [Acidimicrobiales bacterium]